jgi:hypothetical protein
MSATEAVYEPELVELMQSALDVAGKREPSYLKPRERLPRKLSWHRISSRRRRRGNVIR